MDTVDAIRQYFRKNKDTVLLVVDVVKFLCDIRDSGNLENPDRIVDCFWYFVGEFDVGSYMKQITAKIVKKYERFV